MLDENLSKHSVTMEPVTVLQTEADDVIYVGTKHATDKTIIVSSDRDFRQLVSKRVKLYDPMKKAILHFSGVGKCYTKHKNCY